MPQRGVRFKSIRRIVDFFAGIIARQEMEQRANTLLTELIDICKLADIKRIHLVRRYGDYIHATGGCASEHNRVKSRRIDDADYLSLLALFNLDIDDLSPKSRTIEFEDTSVCITPSLTRYQHGETLILLLAFTSLSTDSAN